MGKLMPNLLDPGKYGLALHTTTPELGIALSNFTNDSRCQTWDLGHDISTHLHQYLAEFIKPQTWADLAFIAVAKGPGGFTGTRIGVVTARTLAQQLDIPLFAVSTLAAVCQEELAKNSGEAIAIQLPAHRGEIFVAIYEVSPTGSGLTQLLPDTVIKPEKWQQTLENWPNSYHLIQASDKLGASVSSVLELAYLDWQNGLRPHWSEALPFYGQHPIEDKNVAAL